MGLNLQGVGFSFVANDKGVVPLQEKIATSFFNISSSVNHLHKQSKPVFAHLDSGLGHVDTALERQEQLVGEWSESFAKSIDHVVQRAEDIAKPFKKSYEAIGSGARVVANSWSMTFGKSFDGLKERIGETTKRFQGLVDATKPIQTRFQAAFKKVSGATKPFTDAFSRARDKVHDFLGKTKETDEEQERETGRYKKRSKIISATTQSIQLGFEGIRGVMRKLNDVLRVNQLQGFISAISVGMLSKISAGISGLGSASMNLTTGLESQMVSMDKSARQTATNLGVTGAELQKVSGQASGLAISLNTGAEAATQAIVAYGDAAKEFGLIGITSAADLVKVTETTGLNAQALANQLRTLHKTFQLSDKDIQGLMSSFTAMGQETRDVSGALSSLPEQLKLMSQQAQLMGVNLRPEQLADFAKQSAALSAGLYQITGSADDARSMSSELAGAMLGAQKEFANMFAGTADDLPGFMKELAIMGGDIDASFKLIEQGPAGFVKGLKMMVDNASSSGADMGQVLNFMRARLEAAGISNTDVLMSFLRTTDKGVLEVMDSVDKSTASLGKLAKEGFSTGRTLQEAFDLAKDAAVAHFRAGGKASKTFLSDFTQSAQQFNKILDETSSKGGPLGQFVDRLRDVHQLGAAGLLPREMQGAGVLLAEIGSQLGPLLGILGGAIAFFPGLTAALGPVVAILGLFSINLFKSRIEARLTGETWKESLGKAAGQTKETLLKAVDWITSALDKVGEKLPGLLDSWGEALARGLDGLFRESAPSADAGVETVFSRLVSSIKRNLPKIGAAFARFAVVVGEALVAAAKRVDWAKVSDTIQAGVKGALSKVKGGAIGDILFGGGSLLIAAKGFSALIPVLTSVVALVSALALNWGLISSIGSAVWGILGKLASAFFSIQGAIFGVVAAIGALTVGFLVAPEKTKTFVEKVKGWLSGFGEKVGQLIGEWGPKILRWLVTELPALLITAVPVVLKALGQGLLAFGDIVLSLVSGVLRGVREGLEESFPSIIPVLDVVGEALGGVLSTLEEIGAFALDAFASVWSDAEPAVTAFGDGLDLAWSTLKSIGSVVGGVVVGAFKVLWAVVEPIWGAMKIGATLVWEVLKVVGHVVERVLVIGFKILAGVFGLVWDQAVTVFTAVRDLVVGVWEKYIKPVWDPVAAFFGAVFGAVWEKIVEYWQPVEDLLVAAWEDVIRPVWEPIADFFSEVFSDIGSAVDSTISDIVGFFEDWQGSIDAVFDSIEQWVDDLFGHSISTDIEKDLAKSWDAFRKAFDKVRKLVISVADTIMAKFRKFFDYVKMKWDEVVRIVERARDSIEQAWVQLKIDLSQLFASIYMAAKQLWDGIVEEAQKIWGRIKEAWGDVKKFFSSIFDGVLDAVKAAVTPIYDTIVEIWDDGKGGGIKGTWGKVAPFFESLWEKIKRFALKIWDEVGKKVETAIGPLIGLFDKIKEIADTIWGNSIHDDANESMILMAKYTNTQTADMTKTWENWEKKIVGIVNNTFSRILREMSAFGRKAQNSFLDITTQMVLDFSEAFLVIDHMANLTDHVLFQMTVKLHDMLGKVELLTMYLWSLVKGLDKARREVQEGIEQAEAAKGKTVSVTVMKFEGAGVNKLVKAIDHPAWYEESKKDLRAYVLSQQRFLDVILTLLTPGAWAPKAPADPAEVQKLMKKYLERASKRVKELSKPTPTEIYAAGGIAQ